MTRRYAILDVFTDKALAGNPLAVVLDGEGLDDARMQAIAREFNLSETVFILPAENPVHSVRARIFTPAKELPFAGHPTVGTAVLLGLEGAAKNAGQRETMLVLEENIGPVRCGAFVKGEDAGWATFDLPSQAVEVGPAKEKDEIANALALLPEEVGFENHAPSVFSAGVAFTFVPVRDLSVISRADANNAAWADAFDSEAASVFVYCRETEGSGRHFHARMFAPTFGIPEDPATGSAVAALSGPIMRFDAPTTGSHQFTIEQGIEMGRTSLIGLELDIANHRIEAARISGDAIVVARGTLAID
jgi:trans-2,3-dihydro-3-hydroxyanthranilate isomerase